MPLNDVIKMH